MSSSLSTGNVHDSMFCGNVLQEMRHESNASLDAQTLGYFKACMYT